MRTIAKLQVLRIWLQRKEPVVEAQVTMHVGTAREASEVIQLRVGESVNVRGTVIEEMQEQEVCALAMSVIDKAKKEQPKTDGESR